MGINAHEQRVKKLLTTKEAEQRKKANTVTHKLQTSIKKAERHRKSDWINVHYFHRIVGKGRPSKNTINLDHVNTIYSHRTFEKKEKWNHDV